MHKLPVYEVQASYIATEINRGHRKGMATSVFPMGACWSFELSFPHNNFDLGEDLYLGLKKTFKPWRKPHHNAFLV